MSKRLAVIGAGPMGLEAALKGVRRGWTVTVFEKGRIGENILKWAHVRLFTPLHQTLSNDVLSLLDPPPDREAFLTGRELVKQVLIPAFHHEDLASTLRENTKVISVSRRRMLKTDLPGHPSRAAKPYQLLIEKKDGSEEVVEADAVIDAGGVYGLPNWAGESGQPVPGERAAGGAISRRLPDLLGPAKKDWIGKKILLIGNGHSAATAIRWFSELRTENPETRVFWSVLGNRSRPVTESGTDPLPERKETVQIANNLAENPPEGWAAYLKTTLHSLSPHGQGFRAELLSGKEIITLEVDKILSLTGFRPDLSNLSELQLEISPVTGGAGRLAKALLGITDCLADIKVEPDQLKSGEENFFLAGHKSYGRLNTFLLESGIKQLEQIFDLMDQPEGTPRPRKGTAVSLAR